MGMKKLRFVSSKTDNGYDKITFNDYYSKPCDLQKSSNAEYDCIWLGISEANPMILTRDAISLGYISEEIARKNDSGEPCGWIDVKLPEEIFIPTKMHLTKEQARQLGMKLLEFSFTGEIGA